MKKKLQRAAPKSQLDVTIDNRRGMPRPHPWLPAGHRFGKTLLVGDEPFRMQMPTDIPGEHILLRSYAGKLFCDPIPSERESFDVMRDGNGEPVRPLMPVEKCDYGWLNIQNGIDGKIRAAVLEGVMRVYCVHWNTDRVIGERGRTFKSELPRVEVSFHTLLEALYRSDGKTSARTKDDRVFDFAFATPDDVLFGHYQTQRVNQKADENGAVRSGHKIIRGTMIWVPSLQNQQVLLDDGSVAVRLDADNKPMVDEKGNMIPQLVDYPARYVFQKSFVALNKHIARTEAEAKKIY